MGLDKWLKPEDLEKKSKKKKVSTPQTKKRKNELIIDISLEKQSIKLIKYKLVCPNVKCKYQKTIMKKELANDDKICPRCDKEMKIKEV
ncbi:MAG: hypothetical protein ACFFDH_21430 [Promethearchaeota archaeon]